MWLWLQTRIPCNQVTYLSAILVLRIYGYRCSCFTHTYTQTRKLGHTILGCAHTKKLSGIVGTPIRYTILYLRDGRGAASLHYRNWAEITVLCEQKPHVCGLKAISDSRNIASNSPSQHILCFWQIPELPKESIKRAPNPNAVALLEKTISIQGNVIEVATFSSCPSVKVIRRVLVEHVPLILWRYIVSFSPRMLAFLILLTVSKVKILGWGKWIITSNACLFNTG